MGGKDRREFITCLKSNQFEGLDSFELSSPFAPFRHDKRGRVVQEIAEASYVLKDRRAGEDDLPLRAILLCKPSDETDEQTDDGAGLHVVITSDWETPTVDIAHWYRNRCPKQENAIRGPVVSLPAKRVCREPNDSTRNMLNAQNLERYAPCRRVDD